MSDLDKPMSLEICDDVDSIIEVTYPERTSEKELKKKRLF